MKLFGRSAHESHREADVPLRGTGGNVDAMVLALVECAYDNDEAARSTMHRSLKDLGQKKPLLVLSACHRFLRSNKKLSQGHRVLLLSVMRDVTSEVLHKLPQDMALGLVSLAAAELTATKDIIPEWQDVALTMLVTIASRYCAEVVDELLRRCDPGTSPHHYLVRALAELAIVHPTIIVASLKQILAKLVALMPAMKQDSIRIVMCAALCRFADAVYASEVAGSATVSRADFESGANGAFDVLASHWISSGGKSMNVFSQEKEAKKQARVASAEAIGLLADIVGRDKLESYVGKLVSAMLNLYKKKVDLYPLTKGLCLVIDVASVKCKGTLENHVDGIMTALHAQVGVAGSSTKQQFELLRCFEKIAVAFPGKVVQFILERLESPLEKNRIGTLDILRHVLNSTDINFGEKKKDLLDDLKPLINEQSFKARRALVQVVLALASRGYLDKDAGAPMVEFVARQCAVGEADQYFAEGGRGRTASMMQKVRPFFDSSEKRRANSDAKQLKAAAQASPSNPASASASGAGQSASAPTPVGDEEVSAVALRSLCGTALQSMASNSSALEPILWPMLLGFFVPAHWTEAAGVIADAIAVVAKRKRAANDPDYNVDFQKEGIPQPVAIISRAIVLCANPLEGNRRGAAIIRMLESLSPLMHPAVVDLWDDAMPKLLTMFDEGLNSDGSLDFGEWEELLLKLLARTVDAVASEEWTATLAMEMSRQLDLYVAMPKEKNFLYRCIGIVLKKTTDKTFLQVTLDTMIHSVDHTEPLEREGCALAFGYCAPTHADDVIDKLQSLIRSENLLPTPTKPKSSSFLGIGGASSSSVSRDKDSDLQADRIRCTALLSFGYVALYSPLTVLSARLEAGIVSQMSQLLSQAREQSLREAAVRSIELLGAAVAPARIKDGPPITFARRSEFITHALGFLTHERRATAPTPLRAMTLDALAALARLEPELPENVCVEVISSSLGALLELPLQCSNGILAETSAALDRLVDAVVRESSDSHRLVILLEGILPTLRMEEDFRRLRALGALRVMLRSFLALRQEALDEDASAVPPLPNLGRLCAHLVPRACESHVTIRADAVECISLLFKVDVALLSPEGDDSLLGGIRACDNLRGKFQQMALDAEDARRQAAQQASSSESTSSPTDGGTSTQPHVTAAVAWTPAFPSSDLGRMFATTLGQSDITALCFTLIEVSSDPIVAPCGSGTLATAAVVASVRGADLSHAVRGLLDALHKKLMSFPFPSAPAKTTPTPTPTDAYQSAGGDGVVREAPVDPLVALWRAGLGVLKSIAEHHREETVSELLQIDLPFDRAVTQMWCALGSHAGISPAVVDQLLKEMLTNQPFVDQIDQKGNRTGVREATRGPMAATCALCDVMLAEEIAQVLYEMQHKVLSGILLRIGACAGSVARGLDPSGQAIMALRQFIQRSGMAFIATELDHARAWESMSTPQFVRAVAVVTGAMCTFAVPVVPSFVVELRHFLGSAHEPYRVVSAAALSEVLRRGCSKYPEQIEPIVNGLLARVGDESRDVRRLSLGGLGAIATFPDSLVRKYATAVLTALVAGLDDRADDGDVVILSAMESLSKLTTRLTEADLRSMLVGICLRIRPCFDRSNDSVRAASISLFGRLSVFGVAASHNPYAEQAEAGFIALVIRLNDTTVSVRQASRETLLKTAPFLESPELVTFLQHSLCEGAVVEYPEFIAQLSKAIIDHFGDRLAVFVMAIVAYFRMESDRMRGNAALFVGHIVGSLPQPLRKIVTADHICQGELSSSSLWVCVCGCCFAILH
eukprot:Opistho-2@51650